MVCRCDSLPAGLFVVCALALWCIAAAAPLAATAERGPGTATVADTLTPSAQQVAGPVRPTPLVAAPAQDTIRRPRAVVLSDWYGRRLTIHRYGSYVMLPLFATEYILGSRLLSQKEGVYDGTRRVPIDATLRRNHRAVAQGVGALFVVNTTTGLWNLWETRGDGSHSTRRTLHVLSMLGANAGFVVTGLKGARAVDRRPSDARAHRNIALASMGLATTGVALMWF